MNLRDMGMIERSEHFRFTLKTRDAIWIGYEGLREDFQGDVTLQTFIAGAVYLTHAPSPQGGKDVVCAELSAGGESQEIRSGLYGLDRPATLVALDIIPSRN